MVDYGYIEEGGEYLSSGINEGFSLRGIVYNPQETYEACDIEFIRGEKIVRDRLFAPNGSRPRKDESEENALKREISSYNTKMRSIVSNFVTSEQITEAFKAKNPKSFKELVELYRDLLPPDVAEKTGRLIMWYKSNGFLEVPRFTNINKAEKIFSINPDEDLSIKPRYESRLTYVKKEDTEEDNFI